MCGEQLRAQEARRHIFKEHLDVEDLFRCSACNFKSSCSQQVVRSHAQRTHGDKNAVVSRLPEFKERISTLELRCFPSKGRRTENEWVTCAICEQVNDSLLLHFLSETLFYDELKDLFIAF